MKLTIGGSIFFFFFFLLFTRPGSMSGSSDPLRLQPPGSTDSLAVDSRPSQSPALYKQYSPLSASLPPALCRCPLEGSLACCRHHACLCFLSTLVWLELPKATQTLT